MNNLKIITTTILNELSCVLWDPDRFSRELTANFISRTDGLYLDDSIKPGDDLDRIDVLFVDADLCKNQLSINDKNHAQLVIISTNSKYVRTMFDNKITDFLYKPELSFERISEAIEKVKKRLITTR